MTPCIASSLPAVLRRPALGSLFVALALTACGGGSGGSDATTAQPAPSPSPPPVVTNPQPDPSPPPIASRGSVSLLDGTLGGTGNRDGVGATARFERPTGLAVGPQGNLYVVDSDSRRIRKVTPAGVVSTVAGSGRQGYVDGPALQASFCQPTRIAVGPDASVFVVDGKVRKIDPAGNVSTVAGPVAGDCGNLQVREAPAPKSPSAVAVDAFGIAYIADSFAGAIYTLTPDGVVTLLAGSVDPNQPNRTFNGSTGIALDGARNLYVLGTTAPDVGTRSIVRVSPAGEVKTVVPLSIVLGTTKDIASDAAGNLYVLDGSLRNLVRKILPDGRMSIIAGVDDDTIGIGNLPDSVDGPLGTGRLSQTRGIAVAADGTVYVSDGATIRRIDPVTGNLSTLAGLNPQKTYRRYYTSDRAGNVFALALKVPYNGEVSIERIAPSATASTTLLTTRLVEPGPIAADSAGNLYVLNQATYPVSGQITTIGAVVRKITPQGEVSLFAGRLPGPNPAPSASPVPEADGVGPAAVLGEAAALTIDPAGNLYVAQRRGAPLRKITPQGVVSTPAATLPGTDQYPNALAADAAGAVYLVSCARPLAEPARPNAAVLKVDPRGNVTQLAGSLTEVGYVDGPGAQARFAASRGGTRDIPGFSRIACPGGLTLDSAGNVYVADTDNDTVRRITPDGMVGTVVGQQGVRGVSLGTLPASLSQPTDLSFDDAAGNLLVRSENALLRVELNQ